MRTFAVLLAILFVFCGCGDVYLPSRNAIYELACSALHDADGVPESAKPVSSEEAVIGIAKNSASVDLPYTYTDADGKTQRDAKTIWFKRVARTWTVTKVEPASNYR